VKPGPYFYLPLVGPTTLRDFIGDRVDLLIMPRLIGGPLQKPEVVVPIWVLSELGRRIEFDEELQEIRATRDPYVAARTHYLQRRQAEIDALRGRTPAAVAPAAPAPTSPAPVQQPPAGQ
jgi:phospholipid-binding lipoprotein MlaA